MQKLYIYLNTYSLINSVYAYMQKQLIRKRKNILKYYIYIYILWVGIYLEISCLKNGRR